MKKVLWAFLVLLVGVVLLFDTNGCSTKKKMSQNTTQTQQTVKTQPIVYKDDKSVKVSSEEEKAEEPRFVTIYFDFDKSHIRPDQQNIMNKNAELLFRHDKLKVLIEGYCDERGTDEYNMALGQKRSDSVKTYLMDYGVAGSRITTMSYGEERPVENGHNESAWSKNRRCEFKIVNPL